MHGYGIYKSRERTDGSAKGVALAALSGNETV